MFLSSNAEAWDGFGGGMRREDRGRRAEGVLADRRRPVIDVPSWRTPKKVIADKLQSVMA